jgi:leucine dehydrogenase
MVAVHSTVRGPALGGCRMWSYDDSRAAVRDALRLSRAMTYKAAVAGLPLGGGKGVIMLPPDGRLDARRRKAVLLDFADTVERLGGSYITAEDVGTSARDMTVIAQGTSHVTGLARSRGGSGDPSPYTAFGVEAAILATCERVFGDTSLAGRSAAVIGLGHVGLRIARLLARRKAKLLVADIDPAKKAEAEKLGARWVTAEKALLAPVDVLVPCALGGILDHESAPRIQAPAVAGAANNQLADEAVADLLAGRVAGATAFWNDEGQAIQSKRPGFHIFRVDDYGAPSYPELVLCATRGTIQHDPGLTQRVVDALVYGYDFTLLHPSQSAADLGEQVPGLDPKLAAGQLTGLLAAFQPPDHRVGELEPTRLGSWARWEARFGIVSRPPDVTRAFDPSFVAHVPTPAPTG